MEGPSAEFTAWAERYLSTLEGRNDNGEWEVAPRTAWDNLITKLKRASAPPEILKEAEMLRPRIHGFGVTRRSNEHPAKAPEDGINPQPGINTNVSDHGGAVTPHPRVYAIFVGEDWKGNIHGINERALKVISAVSDLCSDQNYMGHLSEYGVGSPSYIGAVYHEVGGETDFYDGVFFSGFNVGSIIPGTYVPNFLTNVLDVNSGIGFRPTFSETNLVYMLFLSGNMSLKYMSSGNKVVGQCNVDFCGYHSATWYHKDILGIPIGDANLFYIVICGGDADNNLVTVSHELVETFTDRIPGKGWMSTFNSDHEAEEIGDICNTCNDGFVQTSKGQTVASYWLRSANRCLQQTDLGTK